MKIKNSVVLICLTLLSTGLRAQEVITLPYKGNGETQWIGPEKSYYSDVWQNDVVTNVSVPTLTLYRPEKPNGTTVVIAPGGGLYALSINTEGISVAKWLQERGITAAVLKYRLVPTGEDGVKELNQDAQAGREAVGKKVLPVLPLSIADGLAAVAYVREHADDLGVDSDKVGFMGFSAGGAVTMGTVFEATPETQPDFIIPIYPWMNVIPSYTVREDAPPMMVICATDDPLKLAEPSVKLYTDWLAAGHSPAMHMFSKGGHGFGLKSQGTASDKWIAYVHDWLVSEKIVPMP